jgi:hypothetical protein
MQSSFDYHMFFDAPLLVSSFRMEECRSVDFCGMPSSATAINGVSGHQLKSFGHILTD